MTMPTAFTALLGVRHPVALAPMGGAAGGALAAAVSEAGGLGLIGGGRQDSGRPEREPAIAAVGTTRPGGIGFQSSGARERHPRQARAFRPAAVMLSLGDPAPLAPVVRGAGALPIIQVTALAETRQAIDAGADVIVAQGTEAGGHGGGRSLMPFLPVVADLAAPVPVLAAGGISRRRGLAARLALRAARALVGTPVPLPAPALAP